MKPIFQSGKSLAQFGCLVKHRASMKQLFFKAENTWVVIRKEAEEVGLQWSRFFSKRKTALLCQPDGLWTALQWSRFFSKRKTEKYGESNDVKGWLQWSRFFSKRKTTPRTFQPPAETVCFNGAAFFQSGKRIASV